MSSNPQINSQVSQSSSSSFSSIPLLIQLNNLNPENINQLLNFAQKCQNQTYKLSKKIGQRLSEQQYQQIIKKLAICIEHFNSPSQLIHVYKRLLMNSQYLRDDYLIKLKNQNASKLQQQQKSINSNHNKKLNKQKKSLQGYQTQSNTFKLFYDSSFRSMRKCMQSIFYRTKSKVKNNNDNKNEHADYSHQQSQLHLDIYSQEQPFIIQSHDQLDQQRQKNSKQNNKMIAITNQNKLIDRNQYKQQAKDKIRVKKQQKKNEQIKNNYKQ